MIRHRLPKPSPKLLVRKSLILINLGKATSGVQSCGDEINSQELREVSGGEVGEGNQHGNHMKFEPLY